MASLSFLKGSLSPRGVQSTSELLFVLWGRGCTEGFLHSWNSQTILPDMPSAAHHVNGKEGLEGSQPGAPAPAMSESHIDCRVWRKVMAVDVDSLSSHKATDRGETKLWPWSLYHGWALRQGFPASPCSPRRPSFTPNQVWLP
jgi:hypothetical protein